MGTGPSQSTAARNNLDRTPACFLSPTLLLLLLPAPSNASRWWTFDFAFAKICLFIAFPDPLEQSQPRAINGNFSSEVMRLISSCRIVSNILLDWRSGQVSGSCDPEFQYDFNRCQLPSCRQGNSLPNFGWYKKKKNWISNQMGTWGCGVWMCEHVHACECVCLIQPQNHAACEPSSWTGLLERRETPLWCRQLVKPIILGYCLGSLGSYWGISLQTFLSHPNNCRVDQRNRQTGPSRLPCAKETGQVLFSSIWSETKGLPFYRRKKINCCLTTTSPIDLTPPVSLCCFSLLKGTSLPTLPFSVASFPSPVPWLSGSGKMCRSVALLIHFLWLGSDPHPESGGLSLLAFDHSCNLHWWGSETISHFLRQPDPTNLLEGHWVLVSLHHLNP